MSALKKGVVGPFWNGDKRLISRTTIDRSPAAWGSGTCDEGLRVQTRQAAPLAVADCRPLTVVTTAVSGVDIDFRISGRWNEFMADGLSPFPTTQWTAVVKAMNTGNIERRHEAFSALCRDYWKPLYVFSRRLGHDEHEAKDLTQGFFAYLSQRPALQPATRELGKLRTFLLTIFQRYIGDVRDRGNAQKRGGGAEVYSLDLAEVDELPAFDIAGTETPETLYDRAWAHALLDATFLDLEAAEETAGRGQIFQALKSRLNPEGSGGGNQAVVVLELGMNPEAIRQSVSRLRKKFRDCLRKRIAATLNEPDDARIDEELRALKGALLQ